MKRESSEVTSSLSREDWGERIPGCISFLTLCPAQTPVFTFISRLSSKEMTALADLRKVT